MKMLEELGEKIEKKRFGVEPVGKVLKVHGF